MASTARIPSSTVALPTRNCGITRARANTTNANPAIDGVSFLIIKHSLCKDKAIITVLFGSVDYCLMSYEHTNSKGTRYYLNSTLGGKNGRTLYFFSKEKKSPIDLPPGFIVVESPLTKLPILKKK